MEPVDEANGSPTPPPANSSKFWGNLLIFVGLLSGGLSSFLLIQTRVQGMSSARHAPMTYPANLLFVAGSVALIAAGHLLASARPSKNLAAVALWLAAGGAAAYVFGCMACAAGQQ